MTKREIEMRAGDAAILLHANGDIGLLIPKLDDRSDDDEVPEHVALAMAFGVIARSHVLREIAQHMAEAAMESGDVAEQPAVAQ